MRVALFGGFALVQDDQITILVNGADLGRDLDSTEVEADFQKATQAMQNADSTVAKEKMEQQLTWKRAKARLNALQVEGT